MRGQKLPKPFLHEGVDPAPFKGNVGDDKSPGYAYVYVIGECSKHGISMGNIKIGYSTSLYQRYKNIQHYNGNSVKVFAYWRGVEEDMKRFEEIGHMIAKDNHKHGEWFHFKNTSEIEQLVKTMSEAIQ